MIGHRILPSPLQPRETWPRQRIQFNLPAVQPARVVPHMTEFHPHNPRPLEAVLDRGCALATRMVPLKQGTGFPQPSCSASQSAVRPTVSKRICRTVPTRSGFHRACCVADPTGARGSTYCGPCVGTGFRLQFPVAAVRRSQSRARARNVAAEVRNGHPHPALGPLAKDRPVWRELRRGVNGSGQLRRRAAGCTDPQQPRLDPMSRPDHFRSRSVPSPRTHGIHAKSQVVAQIGRAHV